MIVDCSSNRKFLDLHTGKLSVSCALILNVGGFHIHLGSSYSCVCGKDRQAIVFTTKSDITMLYQIKHLKGDLELADFGCLLFFRFSPRCRRTVTLNCHSLVVFCDSSLLPLSCSVHTMFSCLRGRSSLLCSCWVPTFTLGSTGGESRLFVETENIQR